MTATPAEASISSNPLPLAATVGALGVVILRMALTLREVRRGSEHFRDARTDVLTGLPNRRGFLEDAEEFLALHAEVRRLDSPAFDTADASSAKRGLEYSVSATHLPGSTCTWSTAW